jgi:hypothetical protein
MLANVGDEITYFVANPATAAYSIYELDENQDVLKETWLLNGSLVEVRGEDELRELLSPALPKFLERFLESVEALKEKVVDKTVNALTAQSI